MCKRCCAGEGERCCAACIANRRGHRRLPGHRFYYRRLVKGWSWRMGFEKPCGASGATSLQPTTPEWKAFAKAYPSLTSFLCDLKYADGSSRVGGTVLLTV